MGAAVGKLLKLTLCAERKSQSGKRAIPSIPIKDVVRGQYDPGVMDGKKVVGYRDEDRVNPGSRGTETYAAVKLGIEALALGRRAVLSASRQADEEAEPRRSASSSGNRRCSSSIALKPADGTAIFSRTFSLSAFSPMKALRCDSARRFPIRRTCQSAR